MSDSTTNIPQLDVSQGNPEARINELFDAASATMVYGRNAATCTGLVFGYLGGRWGGFSVANGTSGALTPSTTQYMSVNKSTGAVNFDSSTVEWDDENTYARAYKLTVGTSTITAYEDHRAGDGGVFGSSGGASSSAWKQTVRVATTTAGTLSTSFEDGDTIDGVTLVEGDRILIKNQSDQSENGIYVVAASGTPGRATDATTGDAVLGMVVVVLEGTANADTQWVCTTNAPITVGGSNLVFAQFGGGGADTTQTGEMLCGFIATPANKDYRIVLKAAHGGTITETTTRSASGTCTATFKINTTALGGTVNSVSSSEQSQAHSSDNVFVAGDDIVITISSASTPIDMSFTIKYTRVLA